MDNFLLNLLKVSAGTTLFYLCYLLFFSKDTFYLRNRIFLILTLILPLSIPVLRIPVLSTTTAMAPTLNTFDSSGISETSLQPIIQAAVNSPDYSRLLIWLYLAITGFFLLKILISLISTYRIIGKGKVECNSFPKVIISKNQFPPFSFFPFAVIPEEHFNSGNCTDILDHEFAHIRQGHTFDLLLIEIFIAFQWFNPFVWLIKRSIVLNHEYLADHVSLSGLKSVKEYQYRLLNFQSGFKNISLAHSFNNLIKNRIIMINKKPSRKYAMLKNILILPAAAFVIYAFATPEYHYVTPPVIQPLTIYQDQGIQQKEVKGTVVSADSKPIPNAPQLQRKEALVVVDGVITDKKSSEVRKELGYDMGVTKMLFGKEATDKYGDKGANGVYEITTRKKALAMGLKPPFPRLAPTDFPTFQSKKFPEYSAWVASQAKYPAEAQAKKAEGWVSVNFKIELDGSLSNVVSTSSMVDPLLVNEIIRVIKSSPKWERPVNKDVDEPFTSTVTLKFKLPDQILDDAPFVMVEEMPRFPGGDIELLNFIKNNTKYPEVAEANKIEGRVVVRFVVNTEGKAEGISVLKGVDPMLDAEAVRVISLLPAFEPGMQAGKPVNVWYMVPVGFKLTVRQADFKESSLADILKFIESSTKYHQDAKNAQETGEVFVVLKLGKGGIIKECRTAIDKFSFSAPLMPEVVVVGYNPNPKQNASQNVRKAGGENPALKAECERVAKLLTVKEIPDWNDKDLEFALDFKFILK